MRRRLLRATLALLAVLVLAAGGLSWLALASLPRLSGEITVPGLERPVRIVRDAAAVPHVEAETADDAWFAMGFLHGQDRLWQMEFHRLLARGRLAEVLGPAALPYDRFFRMLGLARHAQAAAAGLSPEARRGLEAYSHGVNAAIARYGRILPPEFLILRHAPEPWQPADSILFQKLMALDLSLNWREELLRARLARRLSTEQLRDLWPGSAPDTPVTLAALAGLPLERLAAALPEAPPPGLGSNVWVVDGTRTTSGKPLLANDPHLGLQMPGHWYLAHLEAPGLSVIGATLPSLPFVVLGRNRDIAWGFTNTGSDTQDLFIERVDPDDPDRYLTPDGSEPFRKRIETIGVRGQEPVVLTVRETRHGPVISDLVPAAAEAVGTGYVLALAWTQLRDDDTTMAAGFALDRATDWPSFVAAAELYQGAQQNMAYADRTGLIGMISPGLVPIRRSGDGSMPVPGWTGAYDWQGTIPADRLPREAAPARGLLVNANNRLVDGDYPYLLTRDWESPLRAERLEALLRNARGLDADRFAAIQLDIASTLADTFLPWLLAAEPAGAEERAILAAMAAWDRRMAVDRPEPLLFAAWYEELAEVVHADELGPLFPAFRGIRPEFMRHVLTEAPRWCDDVRTPAMETCQQDSAQALHRAVARLHEYYGPNWRRWRWGEAHPAVMAHTPFEESRLLRRLFSLVFPIGGDSSTVNVAHHGTTRPELPFGAVAAASYRATYDLADPDGGGRWVAATGQSGHPLSPHYRDQAELWRQGRYLAMTMRQDRYRQDAIGVLVLRPSDSPPDG
ncbi:penicillin acylase family protein [Benzoatithermus flavus]|uniref:Penicillin acylase family protein n=1 Tax=Benzoatithermus flavus TaxID=3108223 RepID=A0ABU8XLX8_9PROT